MRRTDLKTKKTTTMKLSSPYVSDKQAYLRLTTIYSMLGTRKRSKITITRESKGWAGRCLASKQGNDAGHDYAFV